MTKHKTGTRKEWLAARLPLLEAEKELTRRGDEVARRRQELPWVRIDKAYRFETDEGSASLADLFRGRSHDVAMTAISRAPLGKLRAYKRRMGWTFPWASSFGSDFNSDFSVGFTEEQQRKGIDSTYARGLDGLWGMYQWLDRAPRGRNETDVWWRRHDEYGKR